MAYRVQYHHDKGLRGRGRARLTRRIKKIMIAVAILLLLLVIAGVIYTWYMGLHGDKKTAPPLEQPKARKEYSPPATDPNAAVGVYIQSLTEEVTPGSNAEATVHTQPQADCIIKVAYGNVPSKDSGLSPKRADEYGLVKWSWTIEPDVALGKGTVDVTCSRNKRSGYMHGDLTIVKEIAQP